MKPYIAEVRAYIDAQFIELDIRNHGLADRCNVSESKFEKDFKLAFGLTANQYIRKKKIEKAKDLRQNPGYSQLDIMAKIGWNYSERSYRDAYKKLSNVSQSVAGSDMAFQDFGDYIRLSEARSAFDDILLRFVLHLQLGKVKKGSPSSAQIIVDVKDTLIQFTPFGLDDKLYFSVFYDLDNDLLHTTAVSTRIGDKTNCYIPNSLQPYFNILNNIYHRTVGKVNFDIRKSIRNWQELIIGESVSRSFIDWMLVAPPTSNLKIEVDVGSEFIRITNPLIHKLKEQFRTDIKNALDKDFHLSLDALIKYTGYLENDDYNDIERFVPNEFLRKGEKRFKLKTLDLILRVTECPVLRDLQFKNYEYEFPRELLKKAISKVDASKIANLLVRFREETNRNLDDEEYNPSILLEDLLRKY